MNYVFPAPRKRDRGVKEIDRGRMTIVTYPPSNYSNVTAAGHATTKADCASLRPFPKFLANPLSTTTAFARPGLSSLRMKIAHLNLCRSNVTQYMLCGLGTIPIRATATTPRPSIHSPCITTSARWMGSLSHSHSLRSTSILKRTRPTFEERTRLSPNRSISWGPKRARPAEPSEDEESAEKAAVLEKFVKVRQPDLMLRCKSIRHICTSTFLPVYPFITQALYSMQRVVIP